LLLSEKAAFPYHIHREDTVMAQTRFLLKEKIELIEQRFELVKTGQLV